MNKKNIVIIGAGAQMKYALETFSHYPDTSVSAVVKTGREIDEKVIEHMTGIDIIDDFQSLEPWLSGKKKKGLRAIEAIVCLADINQKEFYMRELENMNIPPANAVHPTAVIARTAVIGKNVMINAGTVIQPYASIGNGVMIHAQVDVEHDCTVEDYVNLAPGVKLAGWVTVKKGAVIYTNACVIPCVKIGMHAVVGAGAVVIRDVPDHVTVVGNPARNIKDEREQ
jgi:acetyltransferase EpsM